MNEDIIQKTNRVLETLVDLQRAGAEVAEVSIGDRNPVITLHRPLAGAGSVPRMTRTNAHGQREVVCATNIRGCQVEWQEVA